MSRSHAPRRGVMNRFFAGSLVALVLLAGVARVHADQVRLRGGDVLVGQVVERNDKAIILKHRVLGLLTLPHEQIASITIDTASPSTPAEPTAPAAAIATPAPTPTPPDGAAAPSADAAAAQTTARTPAAPAAPELHFWQGWKGSVDLGVHGSDGNSETFSARGVLGARRMTTTLETKASLQYIYVTDNGIKSKSRGELDVRNDWLLTSSRWGFFAEGKGEYDEFQPWDLRTSLFLGPSYSFIRSETTSLRGRAGLGVTREFGSERNQVLPEALFGIELTHKLSERSKLYANSEILPNLADFPEHRIESNAGYELLVDPQTHMNIKFGITHRYNTDPGQRDDGTRSKANDLEYFVTLGWDF
ncbi:MAG: DUF481 domain-containing protein [Planctomycetota bacterium]|nr:DUF481 domain-containing protein [Planctomycetota bacterium]